MKIALVHDYLNQLGGGERVLDELIALFPQADVYTLLYDERKTKGRYKHKVKGTSFLDFQFARDHHRLFIPLMPLAAGSINLSDRYDLIISDTAGFAKGIRYDKSKTRHISYIHTPLRYAWETENYFDNSPENVALKILAAPLFAYVRHWDYRAGQQPDTLLTNSHYIAAKVKQYYGREAAVVYPPVDGSRFNYDPALQTVNDKPYEGEYYLAVGRLLHYKRFDLIIDAFLELGLPLKIVGTGPELDSLKSRVANHVQRAAHSTNIEFLGFIKDDAELRKVYQHAKAFIMANDEDFGLVMAEAQACGTPVIAYGVGGSKEVVEEVQVTSNKSQVTAGTGIFFKEQTPQSLIEAVEKFEKLDFNHEEIAKNAKRFSLENFKQGIEKAVASLSKKV